MSIESILSKRDQVMTNLNDYLTNGSQATHDDYVIKKNELVSLIKEYSETNSIPYHEVTFGLLDNISRREVVALSDSINDTGDYRPLSYSDPIVKRSSVALFREASDDIARFKEIIGYSGDDFTYPFSYVGGVTLSSNMGVSLLKLDMTSDVPYYHELVFVNQQQTSEFNIKIALSNSIEGFDPAHEDSGVLLEISQNSDGSSRTIAVNGGSASEITVGADIVIGIAYDPDSGISKLRVADPTVSEYVSDIILDQDIFIYTDGDSLGGIKHIVKESEMVYFSNYSTTHSALENVTVVSNLG